LPVNETQALKCLLTTVCKDIEMELGAIVCWRDRAQDTGMLAGHKPQPSCLRPSVCHPAPAASRVHFR